MSAAVPTESETNNDLALGDLLNVWALALLVSVVSAVGLGPALRGARAGLDQAIAAVDQIADTTSQFAAIVTWLLVVHLGIVCLRVARPRGFSLLLVLGTALPVVALMSAQRIRIGDSPLLLALLSSGLSLLLAAFHVRKLRPSLRPAPLLAGLSLSLRAVSVLAEDSPSWSQAAGDLSLSLALLCTLEVARLKTRSSRAGSHFLPVVLFLSLLGAQTLTASSQPSAPFPIVIVGRTLDALLPEGGLPISRWTAGYFVVLSLALLAWTLLSRLRGQLSDHATLVAAAGLALAAQLRPTPLSLAAASLSALALVALSRQKPGSLPIA